MGGSSPIAPFSGCCENGGVSGSPRSAYYGNRIMELQWYAKSEWDEVEGPLSSAMLKARADAGAIKPETLVRRGTEGKWGAASRIKGLFPPDDSNMQAEQPPVAPPVISGDKSLWQFIAVSSWIVSGFLLLLLLINNSSTTDSKVDSENEQLRERLHQAETAKVAAESGKAAAENVLTEAEHELTTLKAKEAEAAKAKEEAAAREKGAL